MRKADVDRMSISSSIYGADEVDKGLTAKMGLFEEIGHAWFVVGSQLFLWNYSDTYVSPALPSQTALMTDAISAGMMNRRK